MQENDIHIYDAKHEYNNGVVGEQYKHRDVIGAYWQKRIIKLSEQHTTQQRRCHKYLKTVL